MKRKKFAAKETFEQNLDRRQVVGVFKRASENFRPFVHMDKPKFFGTEKSLWLRHNSAIMKDREEYDSYIPFEND